ncbi:four helix bundle suffix domain-containing protein [Patescibacteria group bacterium]|nr:four helix bundle suffix domain-containing protein [Patescibacteria group bacterium]
MQNNQNKKRAGYEYLLAYKITVPIYDYTVEFCDRWIGKSSRTYDQMIQAARSGMQNILEGNQQEGMKGYIKLCGIARGSLEELLKDYHSFLRQRNLKLWPREKAIREIREIGEIWEILKKNSVLPNIPNFPNLPDNPEKAANLLITLINQANYLIDKLVISLKDKHMREGGLTEELYRKRKEFRGFYPHTYYA